MLVIELQSLIKRPSFFVNMCFKTKIHINQKKIKDDANFVYTITLYLFLISVVGQL